MQVDNNVRAAFSMKAQHLMQFVYAAAHSADAGKQVVFTADQVPFTLHQVASYSLDSSVRFVGGGVPPTG